jgi:hypothetical protein
MIVGVVEQYTQEETERKKRSPGKVEEREKRVEIVCAAREGGRLFDGREGKQSRRDIRRDSLGKRNKEAGQG